MGRGTRNSESERTTTVIKWMGIEKMIPLPWLNSYSNLILLHWLCNGKFSGRWKLPISPAFASFFVYRASLLQFNEIFLSFFLFDFVWLSFSFLRWLLDENLVVKSHRRQAGYCVIRGESGFSMATEWKVFLWKSRDSNGFIEIPLNFFIQ